MSMKVMDAMERERRIKEIVGNDGIREKQCLKEIEAVCQRFDCVMIPEIVIGGGRMQERVRIQAVPRAGAGVTQ